MWTDVQEQSKYRVPEEAMSTASKSIPYNLVHLSRVMPEFTRAAIFTLSGPETLTWFTWGVPIRKIGAVGK